MSFALFETPGNPIPPGARVLPVTTRDGATLRAAWWPSPARTPRGTVCLLQGRAEFIEKYAETVAELLSRGFAVAAFDWRGQGFSERDVDNDRKGHVADFALFAHDLAAVREQVVASLPEPHFALGHSMGGAIALLAAKEGRLSFERLVAVAPMVALCMVRRPRAAMRLAYLLNGIGLGRAFVPGGGETSIATKPFPGNRLTADPARYARNAAAAASAVGAGAVGDPTIGWLAAAFRLMRLFEDPAFPLSIRLPTLIVAAGSDPVCATPAIERFAARLKAGHAVVIPGARHEILMEREAIRAQFWAAFDAFVPGTRGQALAAASAQDAARAARRGDLEQVA